MDLGWGTRRLRSECTRGTWGRQLRRRRRTRALFTSSSMDLVKSHTNFPRLADIHSAVGTLCIGADCVSDVEAIRQSQSGAVRGRVKHPAFTLWYMEEAPIAPILHQILHPLVPSTHQLLNGPAFCWQPVTCNIAASLFGLWTVPRTVVSCRPLSPDDR